VIPETHPLREMFLDLVSRHYGEEIGLRDAEITGYVANMLTEFLDVDHI
jgi:hypothetical protein